MEFRLFLFRSFLFTPGRSGEGKATPLDDRGDDAAARLVDAGNHPEILRLARQPKDKAKELARNITIEQVRQMIRRLHLSLSLGEWRVIVVDAVDDLETDGANALLKTLEEPPAKTLFLLVSHSPGRSEEHTSELQSLMRISYAVFCLKKKKKQQQHLTQNKE